MDDTNNPSIPASNQPTIPDPMMTPPSQPVMEVMPEMPMPGPMTTTTTTTQPMESQFGGQATTTTSTTTETLPPTPMTPEVQWPGSKPKSKLPQVLGGIAAIILVVGVATAAYFVSSKVSGRQAVAPNAPSSQPQASAGCNDHPEKCGKNETCVNNVCRQTSIVNPEPTAYSCNATNCPAPAFHCSSPTNCVNSTGYSGGVLITVAPTAAPSGTASCTLGASCTTSSGTGTCRAAGPGVANYCQVTITSAPTPIPTATTIKVTMACAPGHTCTTSSGTGTCVATTVNLGFMTQASSYCEITVAAPTGTSVNCPTKKTCSNGTVIDSCSQTCPTTTVLTCVKKTNCPSGTTAQCYGTQATCIPSDPSVPFCANSHPCPAGMTCDGEPFGVPGSSFEGMICRGTPTTGGSPSGGGTVAPTKKPGGGGGGGGGTPSTPTTPTADGGACVETKLFAKTADGYSATAMTTAQLTTLKIGDKIRIAITGNKAELKARFKVTINGTVEATGDTASPEWRMGQNYAAADHLTTYYSDYEIKSAGNYTFEGQVQ